MAAADLAIIGAKIRTLDLGRPWASGVAARDGVIVAVGDDATVRAACDGRTEVIDGAGMHVVPGLTDAHFHPYWGTEATRGVDLTRVRSLDELRTVLAAERQRLGSEGWLIGWGLTFELWLPTGIRGDLCADAVGNGPAYLSFFDGHTAVASPAALAMAGVTGRETFADFSMVVVDDQGAPTGELRETGAMGLVQRAMPQPTATELRNLLIQNMRKWNAVGLTGIHAMIGKRETLQRTRELEESGELSVRMIVPLWQEPEDSLEAMRALLPLRNERGRRWRGGVAKFFIDGVVETGTAWLTAPDTQGEGTAPFWPEPEKYRAAVKLFAEAGFQCVTHAVGDMAVRYALDAYEAAGAAPGVRHRVEHIELLEDVDLPRFARLGVSASMQPLHMVGFEADGSDTWSTRVGPERRKRAFRTREILDSGANLALGSDWMVAPYDPRIGLAWARLRREPGRPDRGAIEPRQALTAKEALAGYTTGAAYAVSEEGCAGCIKEGYRADLSAFGEDVVAYDPDELPAVPVRLTVVDGEVVYRGDA